MSKIQEELTEKMRATLIDWLIEIHNKFKLLPETLFLTENIIDRFLEKKKISRQNFQLLGITAMLIACKYEEIYAPEIKSIIYAIDNAYSKQEIKQYEGIIIKVLDFNLNHTSAYRFLERYELFVDFDNRQKCLCRYFLELGLLDYKMLLKYNSRLQASSSIYLVNKLMKQKDFWNKDLIEQTHFEESELRKCSQYFWNIFNKANSSQSVYRKFSHPKFFSVSKIVFTKL